MTSQRPEPIAIVGSGCRYPGGATSASKLWELLKEPRDVVKDIPADRFDTTGFFHPDGMHHGTSNVRHAYLLEQDMRVFDAQFFYLSPNEADSIDPQQRLLLETVYEALEAGGHTLDALRGSDTAVYVGTMNVDWNDMVIRDLETIPRYFATGTNRAIIANRLSYFFDWHGPSMTIDTACSSSLVAVHQGVQALRTRESRVAVACGTQVILGPEVFILESKMKMLSPTGHSRMWDADADGYARGEGVAAVVMKRLSDAIADGDYIQCLIRETSTNQDGYSNGLTVPSAAAQAALIRKTYQRAGLDLSRWEDRPQYFEAHGTGTKAGDPREARAIADCFSTEEKDASPLYVGSVKTVIGHTEGAAGLAGLLKGAVSIQNGCIPPNLHFDNLNPDIDEFYRSLEVPTRLTPWPALADGVPRRVSVNSFGFGGSNAHAILEQYVAPSPATDDDDRAERSALPLTPFLFSAASESSLTAQLRSYADHLKTHPDVDPVDLAWTLHTRKSQLPIKAALAAATVPDLVAKLEDKLADTKQPVGTRSGGSGTGAHILGVFTGQGAQWAAMGAELIKASPNFVARRIQELEDALASLPEADRPAWSLTAEMLATADTSRIGEAALSQPLCTALQVILVDMLARAGVTFSAVVGHSSGEIGAAYAAGFLSATDAIRVAYYRGLYAKLAGSASTDGTSVGKGAGAMLAAGTSFEDAQELVNLASFKGQLAVAAHNSASSVTLSGDVEAVLRAKKVFDEEKVFARLLKVDTAYHSHHMLPCGAPYVAALRACGVTVRETSSTGCKWYSSVTASAEPMGPAAELQDTYWRDNMTNAVLFADAVRNAMAGDPEISLAVEVGPHPALKGPASQNIADARTPGAAALPYGGVLSRGTNDVAAFADGLGFLWTQLGAGSVDFDAFHRAVLPETAPRLIHDLPAYRWNHARSHWHESRKSKKLRARQQPFHELLGIRSPESSARDLRWTNVLKTAEIPWLDGHQLEGQAIFPAAGYVSMALEAASHLVSDKGSVELFELHDLVIPKAIVFDDGDNAAVETLVTLTGVRQQTDAITAEFACYSCPSAGALGRTDTPEMDFMAGGTVKVVLGTPHPAALAAGPTPDASNMVDIDIDRFYSSLGELGYGYQGSFRTLNAAKRRLNQTSSLVSAYAYDLDHDTHHLVHPTMLDVSFQAAILAYSAPGDGRLWSLHVPTSIGRIRVNPELCASLPLSGGDVPVLATVTGGNDVREPFAANIDILGHDADGGSMVQIEDLIVKPFAPATANDDRHMFSYTKWHLANPDGPAAARNMGPPKEEVEIARVLERVALYYLAKWKAELTADEWAAGQPHHHSLRDYVYHTIALVESGQHPYCKAEWLRATPDEIAALKAQYPDNVDLKLIAATGENMVAAVKGETTIIEHMVVDDMLDDYYAKGIGLAPMNDASTAVVEQIMHRYPHARILEIGAGTGSTTKKVLNAIGHRFSSYTYTDISAGFFDKAAEVFEAYSDQMTYKVLDAERSPESQGFEPGAYDIVIANNVLHATVVLQRTLENTRQLLKPGGYLVLAELTDPGPVRFGQIMGGFTGWWLGVNDGRKYSPTLTPRQWHQVLRKAGFGGVDAVTPEMDPFATWPFSIIAAQAVDDRVNLLRRPLLEPADASLAASMYHDHIVLMGTQSLESSRIAEELAEYLSRFSDHVTILDALPTAAEAETLDPMSTFVNLVDLDDPIFRNITEGQMDGLKRVVERARHLLWITHGGITGDNPYHMASVTFLRAMANEAQHVGMHLLDVADLSADKNVSKAIAEHLLRQAALDEWEREAPPSETKIRRYPFLWSKEPEAFLDKRGQLQIPRLRYNEAQNDRLNAARRVISRTPAEAGNTTISLRDGASPSLVEQSLPTGATVRTDGSSAMALRVAGEDYLFLGVGKDTTQDVVFLSTSNAAVTAPVARVPAKTDDPLSLLVAVTSQLLTAALFQIVSPGSSVVIYSPAPATDRFLAAAVKKEAALQNVQTTFVTTQTSTPSSGVQWTTINPRAPKLALKQQFRTAPTHFLDLSAQSIDQNVVAGLFPAFTKSIRLHDLARLEVRAVDPARQSVIQDRLQHAVDGALSSPIPSAIDDLVVPLDQIQTKQPGPTTAVRWQSSNVLVEVRPQNAQRLFSADKSYLLFGLTGEIGQSLCEWMIANGAGCVCLASRNPKANEQWLKTFEGTGASVKLYAVDLIDKASLARAVDDIRVTCLPIGGIMNGAMILRDTLFASMTFKEMQEVLAPKIHGSNNLDELFWDEPLDFFVLLSSATALIGNPGQSSYIVASGYMNGLVRQRRRRGRAASAVDIGRVAGIGYIETAGKEVIHQLLTFGLVPLGETDLHQIFAETIIAGAVDAPEDDIDGMNHHAVVTTGLRPIRDDEELRGPWFDNPLFSHIVVETHDAAGDDAGDGKGRNLVPVKTQLAAAATKEQAVEVLQECFATRLCSILQIAADTLDHQAPLVELGMDSLVAVEVRSWFLKELKTDIPVLKLVGGSTLADVCQLAFKKLPEELVATIGTGESKPAPAAPAPKPAKPAREQPPADESAAPSSAASTADESEASSRRTTAMDTLDTPSSTVPPTPAESWSHKNALDLAPAKSIPKTPARAFVRSEPISVGQSRFWFLQQLVEDPTTFNVALMYRMTGHVRTGDLERALRTVTTRHESLRTCFVGQGTGADQVVQKVLARSPVRLEHKRIASAEEAVAEYAQLRAHAFDLETGPLLRMVLLTRSSTAHYLLVNAHHIIMDNNSFQVILTEMDQAYHGQQLGPRPRQYPDFSVAQHQALENGGMDSELKYWRSVFPEGDAPTVLPLLPMARTSSRTAIADYTTHQVSTKLGPDLVARIKALAKAQRSTPFHFYLAAFKAMLFALTDVPDLTIGIADANRTESNLLGSVGLFMNLLALRFRRSSSQSFASAVQEARNTAYAALENSRLPFDVLLQELKVARSSSHNPVFQAFFDYRHWNQEGHVWSGCQLDLEDNHPGRTGYDIGVDVADIDPEAQISLRVQNCFYDENAANLLLETYTHFIDVLSQDPSLSLQETPLFSKEQRARSVQVGRGPNLVQAWPETLPHRIDAVAQEHADKVALQDGLGHRLTYTATIRRIEAIAEALQARGAGPGARVLVYQQAATDWICSMLAIMRIGGVYVPLDLRNPIERLAALAKDCQPSAVLADDTTVGDAPQLGVSVVIDVSQVAAAAAKAVANVADPTAPAAILYTSGSTGNPKGIVIRHSGIRNEMEGYTKTYNLGAERVLQQSAFTFDFSVDQMFTGLVNGGSVYVVPWSKRGDPVSITEIMRTESITYTKVTPSEYAMWMEYGGDDLRQASDWRFAFAGGEPLTDRVLQQFDRLGLEQLSLYNSYGPAEISIASHKGRVEYRGAHEEPIPCGVSLPNYVTYILDAHLQPLPVGMPGEVVIGGAGVSMGYLTDRERTAKVFVPNPHAPAEYQAAGWTSMHRTGDVGHLREDGSLVFRHRIAGDTQVKIRGLRIDLHDIEANLITASAGVLKSAVVSLRKGDPDFLVAHVVFTNHAQVDQQAYLDNLLGRLPIPQYMVPVLAVPLDALPLNSHNKTDRKAIQALALPRIVANADDDAELTETMVQLKGMWREILGKDTEKLGLAITPSTSFFAVGGNSLLIVRLQAHIRQVFSASIRLVDLLHANTLGQMARTVEESTGAGDIDWDQETAPPLVARPGTSTDARTGPQTILVTGATGNLARKVLPALLANPEVHKIHCVAVRDQSSKNAQTLLESDKIQMHDGDLTAPRLGLTEDAFHTLSDGVDVILHLGAVRAFWDSYHMLRASNVQSTQELVRLAAARRIPIHFVSTSGVLPKDVLEAASNGQNASSASAYEPAADGSDGYVASKWAGERVLERSAASLGVPAYIYRLLPPGRANPQKYLKWEALDEFLRCVDRAGVMPDVTGWSGHVNLMPGKQAAAWLAASVITSGRAADAPLVTVRHAPSPVTVAVDELRTYLEETRGDANLPRLPLLKWMGRLKAAGFGFVIASMETTVGDRATQLTSRR